jgi:dipeptidyl aminopeptidase/acylaminoacyl peptidase
MVLLAGFAHAQQRTSLDSVFDSLASVLNIPEVSISPDGTRVAWVQEVRRAAKPACAATAAYWQSLDRPTAPLPVSDGGACEEGGIAWSPGGQSIAFLSDAATPGQVQLYVKSLADGSLRRLTNARGALASPQWSPDGEMLAVLVTENSDSAPGPMAPKAPILGQALQTVPEQRIVAVDIRSARSRTVSPPDLYVYEYEWSGDSKSLVATAAHGEGDANWYVALLYTISVTSGETKAIWKPPFQIAAPRWSPDGQSVAVIGGLMSDEGITGGDIYLVPVSGGDPRNLTRGLKASPSWVSWLDNRLILFMESIDGEGGLVKLDVGDGRMDTFWRGAEAISTGGFNGAVSLSHDGKLQAMVSQSFQHPPEVWAGPIGSWHQITHINDAVQPAWGKAESIHWGNRDNLLQGWLLYPFHYNPQKRYPMIVAVHGGPTSMSRPRWPGDSASPYIYNLALLAHEGYFIFYPNFRGSLGQGEDFARANVKDFGYGDFQDILSGVDKAIQIVPVDRNRIGIAGWSYGGYMAMWAVTQTDRFRSAVAGAGIANWQSYYGENRIDQWLIPFFGASVYDAPSIYARSSPIEFIRQVRTPTLVMVGANDGECPPPQSQEFWHALRTLGVPADLIVYPGEGHQITDLNRRRDVVDRTLAWFNRYTAQ